MSSCLSVQPGGECGYFRVNIQVVRDNLKAQAEDGAQLIKELERKPVSPSDSFNKLLTGHIDVCSASLRELEEALAHTTGDVEKADAHEKLVDECESSLLINMWEDSTILVVPRLQEALCWFSWARLEKLFTKDIGRGWRI